MSIKIAIPDKIYLKPLINNFPEVTSKLDCELIFKDENMAESYTIPPTVTGYTFPPFPSWSYNISTPSPNSIDHGSEFIAQLLFLGSIALCCLTCSGCYVQKVGAARLKRQTTVTALRSSIS